MMLDLVITLSPSLVTAAHGTSVAYNCSLFTLTVTHTKCIKWFWLIVSLSKKGSETWWYFFSKREKTSCREIKWVTINPRLGEIMSVNPNTHSVCLSQSSLSLSQICADKKEKVFPGQQWPSKQEFRSDCLWLPAKISHVFSDMFGSLWLPGILNCSKENALTNKCVEITSKCNFGWSWLYSFWREVREWISMLSLLMGGCCLPKGGVKSPSHFWYPSLKTCLQD